MVFAKMSAFSVLAGILPSYGGLVQPLLPSFHGFHRADAVLVPLQEG